MVSRCGREIRKWRLLRAYVYPRNDISAEGWSPSQIGKRNLDRGILSNLWLKGHGHAYCENPRSLLFMKIVDSPLKGFSRLSLRGGTSLVHFPGLILKLRDSISKIPIDSLGAPLEVPCGALYLIGSIGTLPRIINHWGRFPIVVACYYQLPKCYDQERHTTKRSDPTMGGNILTLYPLPKLLKQSFCIFIGVVATTIGYVFFALVIPFAIATDRSRLAIASPIC